MRKLTTIFSLILLAAFFSYNELYAQVDSDLIGEEAPGFELKNIDGSTVALDDYLEDDAVKGAIVIFTCNHCPYAKLYEDRIVALDAKFKSQGFPVIAINPNDPEAYPEDDFKNMIKRAEEKGFTFPYLVDETQDIAKAYAATRTPHNYLLNKEDGKFVIRYVGAIDDAPRNAEEAGDLYMEDAVQALMEGESPDVRHTKAVGCSIKWKKS